MNKVKDIISIVKYKGKYMIYFPYLKKDKKLLRLDDRICKWWGRYDTFDGCFEMMKKKNKYIHIEIDKKLLREIKIKQIYERTETSYNS